MTQGVFITLPSADVIEEITLDRSTAIYNFGQRFKLQAGRTLSRVVLVARIRSDMTSACQGADVVIMEADAYEIHALLTDLLSRCTIVPNQIGVRGHLVEEIMCRLLSSTV